MDCQPPVKALRLLERTAEIRRRHGLPSPAGAPELLDFLRECVTMAKGK
jgi:hypothetical protein